jgi:hypothetical protein
VRDSIVTDHAGQSSDAAPRPDPGPPRPEKVWVVRVPQPSLSFKNSPYSPRVRLMMLILDGHCRGQSYLWFSNEALAEEFGCEVRNLKELLREMDEDLGLIRRVIEGRGGKTRRLGIVMRRRADPDLPAAETEEELADAIARLRARREGPTRQKTAPASGQKTAPASGQKTAPELRSSSSKEASSDEPGQESPSRPRREEATPDAAPPVESAGEVAPAAPAATGPTAGQLEALATLSPEQRARFDGWSEGKRAMFLAPHAVGLDPAALRMAIEDLRTAPPPPLPGPDAGPAELIAALAGPMGRSLLARCSNALMVTLDDRGGSKSWGAALKLCGQVMHRHRPPESLSGPLAKTLAEVDLAARGLRDPIENRAAYWQQAVQNFDREHGGGCPS